MWGDDLSLRDILGPLIGLLVGLIGAHTTRRTLQHTERDRAEATKAAAVAAHHQADAFNADALTKRFQALMDGYESQIEFLTTEVTSLRDEVAKLRREITDQRSRCADCPYAAA